MKYFLLIEQNTPAEAQSAPLFLTDEEKEALPFSLLPSLAINKSEQSESLTDNASDDEINEETPEEIVTDDTGEELSETPEEAMSDDAGEEISETPEEIAEAHEENATPSGAVLILSDNEEILTKAKTLGMETFRLPKRKLSLSDLLCALVLDRYETVVIVSDQPTDEDYFTIFSDRRSLAVSLSEDSAPTYRANFTILAEEITVSALLDTWMKEQNKACAAPQQTEAKPPFMHSLFEWIELFALSLAAVLLIMTFFIRHSPVIGSSMYPTLSQGDVLLLTQLGFTPETGDIVIIQTDKDDLRRPLVKRVIATEGQTVRIDFPNWQIYIDGILLKEDYLSSTNKQHAMETYSIARYFTAVDAENGIYEGRVPEGHLFVLGDNRNNSKDSRDLGFIDERHVIGEVVYRLLPLSAMGDPT